MIRPIVLKLLILLIIIITVCCTNKTVNHYDLPTDSLIHEVVKQVMDSIDKKNNYFNLIISKQLCPYTKVYYKTNRDTKTPPPPIDPSIISPISPSDLLQTFESKGVLVNSLDTSYFALQIANSNERYLDSSIFSNCKFVKIAYRETKDYMRLDSILVFFVPIFTADKKFAFVNYHRMKGGTGTILRFENSRWSCIAQFDTWNSD